MSTTQNDLPARGGPLPERSDTRAEIESAARLLAGGDRREAARLAREVLARVPDDFNAWHLLGVIHAQARDLEAALGCFERALQRNRESAQVWANRGRVLLALRRTAEAAASFDTAVALDPSRAEWWYQRGTALLETHRYAQCLESFERALALCPLDVATLNACGAALEGLGRLEEAEARYRRAIDLEPQYAPTYSNLGRLLRERGDPWAGIRYLRDAVSRQPDFATAHNNLGCALEDVGDFDAAVQCYEHALRLAPDSADFEYNLSIALLRVGRYAQGWPAFEARLRSRHGPRLSPPSGLERWNGGALGGKRLVLVAEQGIGDAIHFSRYGALLNARGITPMLQVDPTLAALLATTGYFESLPAPGALFDPASHVWYPLLSLPLLFATDAESIPSPSPYLRADAFKVERWRTRLREIDGLRVGIKWQGNPRSEVGAARGRSMPLEELADLAHLPGIKLISLEKGTGAEQLAAVGFRDRILDWTGDLDTLEDTAALLSCLDVVVSVDTGIAHLAGALGQPVWLALHRASDWRWLVERRDSPWYSSMRLFRQTKVGNWRPVLSDIRAELSALAGVPVARSTAAR